MRLIDSFTRQLALEESSGGHNSSDEAALHLAGRASDDRDGRGRRRGAAVLDNGLAASVDEQRATVNGVAGLAVGVLVRRVARVAALGVVLAWGGAGAGTGMLRAAGAGRLRDDDGAGGDGLVAAVAEDVAAADRDAALTVGVLVRRVA